MESVIWILPLGKPPSRSASLPSRMAYVSKDGAPKRAKWVSDECSSDETGSLLYLAGVAEKGEWHAGGLLPSEVPEPPERREMMLRTLRRMLSS